MPVDWSNPDGEKFDLAIGRLRALEPENRIGVLVLLPGGPGASGINTFITRRKITDDSILRKRFDIVSWDPRGTGQSHPVLCNSELLHGVPREYPETDPQYKTLLEYNERLAADCRSHTGSLIDHVDTVSTVRDLDAIRAALGEEKISTFGISYGTQIGYQYAELFPHRIRAMVLDSNIDHSEDSALDYMLEASRDFENGFLGFADWCGRTPSCKLYGTDVRGIFASLRAKAKAGELIDPDTGMPWNDLDLRAFVMLSMYNPNDPIGFGWSNLALKLAQLLDSGASPASTEPRASEELEPNSYQAIWCQDWKWNVTPSQLKEYHDILAARFPHTEMSLFFGDVTGCIGWPTNVVNPQHRLQIAGVPPVLLVTARHDVAAPHAQNTSIAGQIANSVLLHYDGVGHAQYFNSPCIRQHTDAYLTALVTPPRETHCAAVLPAATLETTSLLPAFSPNSLVHAR